jgi:Ca-activated chloride channel homolog
LGKEAAFRIAGLMLLALYPGAAPSQQNDRGYAFQVQVNEVTLPFRAVGADGRPLPDLRLTDLYLTDNRKAPRKILSFSHLTDQPIRVGFLLDASASINGDSLYLSQDIASLFARDFLRPTTDDAFVSWFDFEQKFLIPWTSNPPVIESAISTIGGDRQSRMGGTAIFDALYRGIRDEIAQQTIAGRNSNAILLFSDGDDNASHARLDDVIGICQRTNTAIYAFSSDPQSRFNEGEKTLHQLADQSGGRVFFNRDTPSIRRDLSTMEQDLRDYYLIVYRPATLKPNGAFHNIRLQSLRRDAEIKARSGYYAPQPNR